MLKINKLINYLALTKRECLIFISIAFILNTEKYLKWEVIR